MYWASKTIIVSVIYMQKYRCVIALSVGLWWNKKVDQEEKTFSVGLTRLELRFCLILVFNLICHTGNESVRYLVITILYRRRKRWSTNTINLRWYIVETNYFVSNKINMFCINNKNQTYVYILIHIGAEVGTWDCKGMT